MKKIIFVTSNKRKIGEAKLGCDLFNIKIKPMRLTIDEIQSHNPISIAKKKAEAAFSKLNKPLVVTDTHWSIPALNGFPGGYMKDISEWFTSEDFINLINDKEDKRVSFTESIVYKDSAQSKIFSKEYWGSLVNRPRGKGNSIENIAEF